MKTGKNAIKMSIHRLNIYYRHKPVLTDINMEFPEKSLTAIVGPSGCGKSTLLMSMNRLLDAIPHARCEGRIDINVESGETIDVFRLPEAKLSGLRRRVGLVFQHPNVLPTSVLSNLAFPLRLMGLPREQMKEKIRLVLERVFLWEEVKGRLESPAMELSGGQQHRLCLARTLVMEPQVILLDEPTSFLDESLAQRIESLLLYMKENQTLIVVSHYLDQVKRLSDRVYRLS